MGGNDPGTQATAGRPRRPPADGASWSALWQWATERSSDEVAAGRLLEEVAGLDRARLLLAGGEASPAGAPARLEALVERVAAGEPLQYVLGHWGFRTLELTVGPDVLVPRPETEVVAGVAIDELRHLAARRAADLGTGSGAIALSLAAEVAGVEVFATDRSPGALAVARQNAATCAPDVRSRIRFVEGDWYAALPPDAAGSIDVIVSNPPYVSEAEWRQLEPVVRLHEPYGALVAGAAGTEDLATIVAGAPAWLTPRGSLVVEIAPGQAGEAVALAEAAGFAEASVLPDLAGRHRALLARR